MSLADFSPVADHLWQSTLFVVLVWLLALVVRSNRAQVRYWLWLAASMKFLVPFAALVAVGGQVGWQSTTNLVQPEITFVIEAISQPFSRPEVASNGSPVVTSLVVAAIPMLLLAVWLGGSAMHLLGWWVRWRRVAAVVREASPVDRGRELDRIRRLEGILGIRQPIAVVSSDTSLEPGVFGIWKPVLVWPRSIGERLADGQLEAILTHELCHVRRRDNLAAAAHMIIEAAFWFHPLVWWIEKRLVDERERACDEEVIRLGSDPQLYAESILKTCEFHAESPLVCVSGVTGSDLKKRVETIMRAHSGERLNGWKAFLLSAIGVLAVAAPVIIGVVTAPRLQAQLPTVAPNLAFEVASIKVNKSNDTFKGVQAQPGGQFTVTNLTLRELIGTAYEIPPPLRKARMSGGPNWIDADRFDIVAKAEGKSTLSQHLGMLRTLLADRFQLVAKTATREVPIYALVVARSDRKLGPQLRKVPDVDCAALRAASRGLPPSPPPSPSVAGPCSFRVENRGHIMSGATTMADFVRVAFPRMVQDRVVVDRTGLVGSYSVNVEWTPEAGPFPSAAALPPGLPVPPPPTTTGPSVFTALQEQLGLKLESTRGAVEVLVIDSVEQPTPD